MVMRATWVVLMKQRERSLGGSWVGTRAGDGSGAHGKGRAWEGQGVVMWC